MQQRLILSLALTACVTLAQAQTPAEKWELMQGFEGKPYKVYLDTARTKTQGDVMDAWVRHVFSDKRVIPFINQEYDSVDRLYYLQCKERKVVVAKSNFTKAGKVVQSYDISKASPFSGNVVNQPQDIAAGTQEEDAYLVACKPKP